MSEHVTQADAVALFLQHARRIHRKFTPRFEELTAVVKICHLVEGMPLALELAAAWVVDRPCTVIVGELEAGLDLLHTTVHNAPARQRSVRATFEHSWTLLPDSERRQFARLSVFRGGFTAEAAGAVAGASPQSLSGLAARSLVRKLSDGRYELHELLRQFAEEKLAALGVPGDAQGPAALHAAYYARFLAEREEALKGAEQERALRDITVEIANVRRAWEWAGIAVKQDTTSGVALEIYRHALENLFVFYTLRSWYQEGAAAYAQAVSAVGDRDPLLLGELLARQARCSEFTAPTEEATALYLRSLGIFEDLGAEREMALPLYGLGYMAHIRGEYETARRHLTASAERYETAGDRWGLANALSSLCLSVRRQGAFEEARQFGLQSLAIRHNLGDRRGIASSQNNIGLVLCAQGDYAAAEVALRESLDICREMGHTVGAANALTSLTHVGLGAGDVEKAIRYQERSARTLPRGRRSLGGGSVAEQSRPAFPGARRCDNGAAAAARGGHPIPASRHQGRPDQCPEQSGMGGRDAGEPIRSPPNTSTKRSHFPLTSAMFRSDWRSSSARYRCWHNSATSDNNGGPTIF